MDKKNKNVILFSVMLIFIILIFTTISAFDWSQYGGSFPPMRHSQTTENFVGEFDNDTYMFDYNIGGYAEPIIEDFNTVNSLNDTFIFMPSSSGSYMEIINEKGQVFQEIETNMIRSFSERGTYSSTNLNDKGQDEIVGIFDKNDTHYAFKAYEYNYSQHKFIFEYEIPLNSTYDYTSPRCSDSECHVMRYQQDAPNSNITYLSFENSTNFDENIIVGQAPSGVDAHDYAYMEMYPVSFGDFNSDGEREFISYTNYAGEFGNEDDEARAQFFMFNKTDILFYKKFDYLNANGEVRNVFQAKPYVSSREESKTYWNLAILEKRYDTDTSGPGIDTYNLNSYSLDSGNKEWGDSDDLNGDDANYRMAINDFKGIDSRSQYIYLTGASGDKNRLRIYNGYNGSMTDFSHIFPDDIGGLNSLTLADMDGDSINGSDYATEYYDMIVSHDDKLRIFNLRNESMYEKTLDDDSICVPADMRNNYKLDIICGQQGGKTLISEYNLLPIINYTSYSDSSISSTNDTITATIHAHDKDNDTIYYQHKCKDDESWNTTNNLSNIRTCSWNKTGIYNFTIGVTDKYHSEEIETSKSEVSVGAEGLPGLGEGGRFGNDTGGGGGSEPGYTDPDENFTYFDWNEYGGKEKEMYHTVFPNNYYSLFRDDISIISKEENIKFHEPISSTFLIDDKLKTYTLVHDENSNNLVIKDFKGDIVQEIDTNALVQYNQNDFETIYDRGSFATADLNNDNKTEIIGIWENSSNSSIYELRGYQYNPSEDKFEELNKIILNSSYSYSAPRCIDDNCYVLNMQNTKDDLSYINIKNWTSYDEHIIETDIPLGEDKIPFQPLSVGDFNNDGSLEFYGALENKYPSEDQSNHRFYLFKENGDIIFKKTIQRQNSFYNRRRELIDFKPYNPSLDTDSGWKFLSVYYRWRTDSTSGDDGTFYIESWNIDGSLNWRTNRYAPNVEDGNAKGKLAIADYNNDNKHEIFFAGGHVDSDNSNNGPAMLDPNDGSEIKNFGNLISDTLGKVRTLFIADMDGDSRNYDTNYLDMVLSNDNELMIIDIDDEEIMYQQSFNNDLRCSPSDINRNSFLNVVCSENGGNSHSFYTSRGDTLPPSIKITNPSNGESFVDRNSIYLNYTISGDYLFDSCWYKIEDENGNIEKSKTMLPNCENTTFDVSSYDTPYYVSVYSNDTWNNTNFEKNSFIVVEDKPSINLYHPKEDDFFENGNNIKFNFSSSDTDDIDTCKLYGDWNGNWEVNETFNPESDEIVETTKNLSNGKHKWNVWCNDTIGNSAFGLNNITFFIGKYYPNKPLLINPNNNAKYISRNPKLIIETSHPNEIAPMNVSFYNASNDAQIGDTKVNIPDGSRPYVYWSNLDYNTTYEWYVNITDETTTIKSDNWNFTTLKDTFPPNITKIPASENITYNTDWSGVNFDASDYSGIDKWFVNDTNFNINESGYLNTKNTLSTGTYNVNVSVNDTKNNINSTVYTLVVNKADVNIDIYFSNETTTVKNDNLTIGYGKELNVTSRINITKINQINNSLFDLYKNNSNIGSLNNNYIEYLTNNLSIGKHYFNSTWDGNENYTSATRDPTVTVKNNPPNQPKLNYPEDGQNRTELRPFLNVTASDPEGDNMTVEFRHGNYSNSSFAGNKTNVTNNSIVTDWWFTTEGLTENKTYQWFVKVYDENSVTESDVWNFTVNIVPDKPVLFNPSNEETNVSTDVTLNVSVSDGNNDSLNVTFYEADYWNLTKALDYSQAPRTIFDYEYLFHMRWGKEGDRLYFSDVVNTYQYDCVESYDPSTCSDSEKSITDFDGFYFDEKDLYGSEDSTENNLTQWECGTNWEIDTCSQISEREFSHTVHKIDWNDDKTKMYLINDNDYIYQYNCSSDPGNISVCSYTNNNSMGYQISDFQWKPDGNKFYISSYGQRLYSHNCSEKWNISSCSSLNTLKHENWGPHSFDINKDGSRFYLLGGNVATIFDYRIGEKLEVDKNVDSGDRATYEWTGLDNNKEYEWFTDSYDGVSNSISNLWSFTTEIGEGIGGGGGVTIIETENLSWDMTTEEGLESYDIYLIEGRSLGLYFTNEGTEEREISLSCDSRPDIDETQLNDTEDVSPINYDICEHVEFEEESFNLPVGQDIGKIIRFDLKDIDELKSGTYVFNILAEDEDGGVNVLTVKGQRTGLLLRMLLKIISSFVIFGVTIGYWVLYFFIIIPILWLIFQFGIYKVLNIKKGITALSFISSLILGVVIIWFL
ncbi:MAG: hypothetical protein ACOCRK_04830 [bacterium]